MNLAFVTGNRSKLSEAQVILGPGIKLVGMSFPLPEIQGTADEIVRAKCEFADKQLKCELIVDDTSLCFDAWNGMPGPYIKDFCATNTLEEIYDMIARMPTQKASAICKIGYVDVNGTIHIFTGELRGSIVKPVGTNGFGWDKIFEPEIYPGQTLATLDSQTKNAISHRTKALEELKKFIG
jgi:inosine triphosphate pyrophosphatase